MNIKNSTQLIRRIILYSFLLILSISLSGKTKTYAENNNNVITSAASANAVTPDALDIIENPASQQTPEPVVKQRKRLKAVSDVCLTRYSTHSVRIKWQQSKKARYYRIYYSKKIKGKWHLAGITKNTYYTVNRLKNNTKYYFYVKACKLKKESETDSDKSKIVHITTHPYIRKTIFAGDSITQGIAMGDTLSRMKIEGKKKIVAAVGLNTVTFHTKRVFQGRTGMQKIIAEKPDRVYMMLGMNEIHYRPVKSMIFEYGEMIRVIKEATPKTEIVLCAISPVTRAEKTRHPGHWQIPVFNKKLKKLASQTGSFYCDYTEFLKDSEGYLKLNYASKDGYHWQMSAYTGFAKEVTKFEKTIY